MEEQVEQPEVKTPQMILVEALTGLQNKDGSYIEVLRESSSDTKVSVGLRVFDVWAWKSVRRLLLKEEARVRALPGVRWTLHICRQDVYMKDEDDIRFFWNFILHSDDVNAAVLDICRLFDLLASHPTAIPPPPKRVERVHLGPSPDEEIFEPSVGGKVVNGEVVVMPLIGKPGRNIPEGGLFEKGKSPKGAHGGPKP